LSLGVAGALVWSQARPSPSLPAAPPASAQRVARAHDVPAPEAAPPEPAAPAVAPAAPAAERAKSAAPRDSLAAEEALLEAARQALTRDPARSLSLLHQHRSQFPSGQLSAERMYLSVDCWQRLGNVTAAKREAAALAKYYPNSAYARRAPLLLASPAR